MKQKIKICFILSHLPQGGAERQILNLIKGLDPSKYDITLLLYSRREIFYQDVYQLHVQLIIHQSEHSDRLFRNIRNAIYLKRFLNRHNFDILHTLLAHNGFWVRLVAPRKYNQRIIYSIRNDLQSGSIFYNFFEKFLIRNSHVVTNSLKVMDQFIKLVGDKFKDKVSNIYNGFEVERFISTESPELTDTIIIGTVGRQTALKNQIQILEAVKRISRTFSLHFYLIGDQAQDRFIENEKYVLTNQLDKYVTNLDSQSEIELYYKRFNIFVLSSISESCPNVLFEAMLAKCLCIVSEGANSDHFIEDGINGLVYDGSTDMLEAKLTTAIKMLRDRGISEMVSNGQKYTLNNFSENKMIMSYEKVYADLLNDLAGSSE